MQALVPFAMQHTEQRSGALNSLSFDCRPNTHPAAPRFHRKMRSLISIATSTLKKLPLEAADCDEDDRDLCVPGAYVEIS